MPRAKKLEEQTHDQLNRGKQTAKDDIALLMQEYRVKYDISSESTPNDIANLETMVRNTIYIRSMQNKLDELAEDDIVENITIIDRLQSGLMRLIEQNLSIEKTLGIDRKSRRKEDSTSVEGFLNDLRRSAREYFDKVSIVVYCPDCQVMVSRFIPVHEHTEFRTEWQCSQCKKFVTVNRKERDVFFDLRDDDRKWRKKYPMEVLQPAKEEIHVDDEDDIIELSVESIE